MRILFVVPNIVSYHFFIGDVCAALRAAGHEPHAVCGMNASFGGGEVADERATMHALDFPRGMNPLGHLRAARELDALVRRLQPDIIHTHFSAALFTTAVARRSHWPLTHGTFHGASFPMMHGLKRHILRFAESWAASRFDDVWVLTPDDRKALQTAAPSARVHVYRSPGIGCLLEHFHPDRVPAVERAALRAELGIPPDAVVFVFVGRLVDFKGFGLTVRSFLRLAAEHPRFRLLNVGPADPIHPSGLTPEEQNAREQCPQIIDVGLRKDVWRYLAISDVMTFPSQREGMPVCIMEALAMGVPVITADSRGCRDVVRDEIDGLVLRDPGVETMAAAMRRLGEDEVFRRRLGTAALADRERFSRDGYVREQVELYAQHLAAARVPQKDPAGAPLWKRLFDGVVAGLALVALMPLMLFTAALIAVKLGRPVLFRQPRPGLGGRPFTMWKFRTMTDARDAAGNLLPDGERLPPFGTWLRSTSLDELPELWNVLRGDMSLVGPRPLLMVYLGRYSPEQDRRHDALPGITGWAQVNGRNAQSWERKFALDTWYVDHVSLRLDLLILWKTVARVLKRDGIAAGPEHVTSPHFWGSRPEEERQGEAEAARLAPAFARRAVIRTAPSTPRFLAGMLGINFVFLALAALLGWWLLGDNRPVANFSALQLLVIAWLAMAIYHARRPASDGSHFQQPRLVWLLIALGFAFLATDQFFALRERMESALHALFRMQETVWTDRMDDFIVVGYGLFGLGVLFAYRRELSQFFGILPFLAIGFAFFGLSIACDIASNRPDFLPGLFASPARGEWVYRWLAAADQIFTLVAECFYAAGFYYAWQQARRASRF